MSKIKTKKVLTPEQKKKRIRNIIIVAVILVAASVATYWMQPQNKALAESEVFSEEEVKAQAEKIIGLLNAEESIPARIVKRQKDHSLPRFLTGKMCPD